MMNFSIKELNAFAVIGQEVELTNYQKKNIQIYLYISYPNYIILISALQ